MKLGVCYYPEQWPESFWQQDAQDMAKLGIQVVRIAEFAWSRMEPAEGRYDWHWLDKAINTLAQAGLKIVLGTPTAAPPRWLVDKDAGVLPMDPHGRRKGFGARRHCDLSNPSYRDASATIVEAMARRYGQHPAVIAWQTDNEFGCHDTLTSYSPDALQRFRQWLAQRYGTAAALNEAWGNVFWSMEVHDFEQIGLPVMLAAPANPIHSLDFKRFVSDEVCSFNRMQAEILRRHSPGRDVLHNFMGFYGEFNHHDMARDLDIASWDSYPLGHTETVPFITESDRQRWSRTGHPDLSAYHHDLMRGLGRGRWWIMEQQAGPVNWAQWNPVPIPGMVRAWTLEAWAHGAEVVSYFRWRQLPYAQEQMHSGLHLPNRELDQGGKEAKQVAHELACLPAAQSQRAPVAMVLDYESLWTYTIQPQGADFHYQELVFQYYSTLRQLGMDIDIVSAHDDIHAYPAVIIPSMACIGPELADKLAQCQGHVLLGPRSGSKTAHFGIPGNLPPGPLQTYMPFQVLRVESLRPGSFLPIQQEGRTVGQAQRWRDVLRPATENEQALKVHSRFADGLPAHVQCQRLHYLAAWMGEGLTHVLHTILEAAGISTQTLTGGLRLRSHGHLRMAINYGPEAARVPVPPGTPMLLGSTQLQVGDVAVWDASAEV
nr:beta-galactosidase [uncultured Rhodoferax sp.]